MFPGSSGQPRRMEEDGPVAARRQTRPAAAVGVDQRRAIGARAGATAGAVGILAAVLLLRRQAVEHGVEVARRDAEEEPRSPEPAEVLGAAPVGLGEEADAQPAPLEEAGDEH